VACGELEEASCLAVILRQTAAAARVAGPEVALPAWVSLTCTELEQARCLAFVLP
jgi:hypothetical protein